jgi:hypothetical protein
MAAFWLPSVSQPDRAAADRDQIAAEAVVDGAPTARATRVTLLGLLGVHTVHYPEVVLGMLIIILRFDRIPS